MTENELSGEFNGIFDDLDPSHFLGQATLDSYVENVGAEKFDVFWMNMIDATRLAFLASDGDEINHIAVLANAEKAVAFVGDDEEDMGQYMDRLTGEADRLKATWFFMCHFTQVGTAALGEDEPDDVSLVDGKDLSRGAFLYGRRKEGDEDQIQMGIAMVYGNRLGELTSGAAPQPAKHFAQVLDGVK